MPNSAVPTSASADLIGARLIGANFNDAICMFTTFGNVDLSEVKGLEWVTHEVPSTVGVDTLFRSGVKSPTCSFEAAACPKP